MTHIEATSPAHSLHDDLHSRVMALMLVALMLVALVTAGTAIIIVAEAVLAPLASSLLGFGLIMLALVAWALLARAFGTAEHARHVIEIFDAAYRAAQTGATQELQSTFEPLPLDLLATLE